LFSWVSPIKTVVGLQFTVYDSLREKRAKAILATDTHRKTQTLIFFLFVKKVKEHLGHGLTQIYTD